jgi:hypothetical protein
MAGSVDLIWALVWAAMLGIMVALVRRPATWARFKKEPALLTVLVVFGLTLSAGSLLELAKAAGALR